MIRRCSRRNPFYPVVVLAGVAFCISSFAYGLMSVRRMRETRELVPVVVQSTASERSFMNSLDKYGLWLMSGELTVLAIASLAAMGTDRYWSRDAD
jgi:hypothetical protein